MGPTTRRSKGSKLRCSSVQVLTCEVGGKGHFALRYRRAVLRLPLRHKHSASTPYLIPFSPSIRVNS